MISIVDMHSYKFDNRIPLSFAQQYFVFLDSNSQSSQRFFRVSSKSNHENGKNGRGTDTLQNELMKVSCVFHFLFSVRPTPRVISRSRKICVYAN